MFSLRLPQFIFSLSAAFLVSCGSVKNTVNKVTKPVSERVVKGTRSVGKSLSNGMASVTKPVKGLAKKKWKLPKVPKMAFFGNDAPPIVEVREDKLQKIKSGEEQYLAYNREKKAALRRHRRSKQSFKPVDLDLSELPDRDSYPSIGLLPMVETDDSFPADFGSLPELDGLPELPGPVPSLPEETEEPTE